jgi:DNA gyrase subunit A
VKEVVDSDELMIITRAGQLIRMPVAGISVIGRNTQGVRLVNLTAPEGELPVAADTVAGVTRVVNEDDAGSASGDAPAGNGAAGDAGAGGDAAADEAPADDAPPDGPEEPAH